MRLFITFQVTQTMDGEPMWRQVDWRIATSGNGYGRDVAQHFAKSGQATANVLYATVQVSDSKHTHDNHQEIGAAFYWQLGGIREASMAEFWSADPRLFTPEDVHALQSAALQSEEEGGRHA